MEEEYQGGNLFDDNFELDDGIGDNPFEMSDGGSELPPLNKNEQENEKESDQEKKKFIELEDITDAPPSIAFNDKKDDFPEQKTSTNERKVENNSDEDDGFVIDDEKESAKPKEEEKEVENDDDFEDDFVVSDDGKEQNNDDFVISDNDKENDDFENNDEFEEAPRANLLKSLIEDNEREKKEKEKEKEEEKPKSLLGDLLKKDEQTNEDEENLEFDETKEEKPKSLLGNLLKKEEPVKEDNETKEEKPKSLLGDLIKKEEPIHNDEENFENDETQEEKPKSLHGDILNKEEPKKDDFEDDFEEEKPKSLLGDVNKKEEKPTVKEVSKPKKVETTKPVVNENKPKIATKKVENNTSVKPVLPKGRVDKKAPRSNRTANSKIPTKSVQPTKKITKPEIKKVEEKPTQPAKKVVKQEPKKADEKPKKAAKQEVKPDPPKPIEKVKSEDDDFEDDFEDNSENGTVTNDGGGGFFLTETNAAAYDNTPKEEQKESDDDDFSDDFEEFVPESKKEEPENEKEPEIVIKGDDVEDISKLDIDPDDYEYDETSEKEKKPSKTYTHEEEEISNVTRNLLAKLTSLVMFGKSDIGATVTEPNEQLGELLSRMKTTFEFFINDAITNQNNPHLQRINKMVAYKKELKKKIIEAQNQRQELKMKLVSLDRAFKSPQTTQVSNSDVKAATSQLKTAIQKIQQGRKEEREIMNENLRLAQRLKELSEMDQKKYGTEVSELKESNAKLEVEINERNRRYKTCLEKMRQSVQEYQEPIDRLQSRLADLEKRVSILNKPKPKIGGYSSLSRVSSHRY